jgi:hypothetical protein
MVNTVNKIPSINLPLTNESGIIHPIWYEFLRSFISSVGDVNSGAGTDGTVIAGAGIVGSGAVSTVNVGQGEGLTVGDDSIGININGQVNAQAAVEDEIHISDASDGGRIRKTSLRDVAALSRASPGGATSQIQYNSDETFAGDAFFTTNGAGLVTFTGNMAMGNDSYFYWPTGSTTTYCIGGTGGTPFMQGASTSYRVQTNNDGFSISFGTSRSIDFRDAEPGIRVNGNVGFHRSILAGITASTTQTQGNGALTRDINEISTCANLNDTVTLPAAQAGRYCLVINNGAQTLQVFPASGDNLGAGLNLSTTIVAGSRKMFIAFDTTNWEPVI